MKTIIKTDQAPAAIGTYSQAVKANGFLFVSGQIAIDPKTQQMIKDDIRVQIQQVFRNLSAIIQAAGAQLSDVVKITVYLTDLKHFSLVNELMPEFFEEPYPARALIGVNELPKQADVEIEAIVAV